MGMLEVSNIRTLFLNEIGDIPPGVQAKFLRFLETGKIRRIGSTREHELDVRIVAATRRDMRKEVREGRFREDLYHRIHVFPLHIPPLRERSEDILPLAGHFLFADKSSMFDPPALDESAQLALLSYAWPGNVRELSRVMEQAAFSAQLASLKKVEKEHMQNVLQQLGGNRKNPPRCWESVSAIFTG